MVTLGEFISNRNNINQDMINNGYGYKYNVEY